MKNSTQLKTSEQAWDRAFNYLAQLNRPKPASPQAIAKAQPLRADTVKKMEAIIKDPSYQIAE
jgi:hypothetical protein